ncbi:twitchin-like isoform X19 [Branchiostoma lanceolatum]|uniref:twitchin-like isoform X19 n=1 Tax=Branchiostoma lanceolatum TaxID=7740 RepID=UPI00345123EC
MAEEAPGFRQPIKSIAVIKGKPAKFEAIVTGTPEPDVSWYVNGQEVAPTDKTQISREEGGRASLVLTSVTDDGGNIACTARNSAGTASSTAKLVVREPPDFVQRLKSQRVKEGSRVEMVVRFKGTPMPKIRWYRERAELQSTEDFRIVTEGDTSRLVIEEVYEDDSGKFSATATNVVGRVISAAHLMVTDTTPPATPTGRLSTPGKLTPGASPGLAPSPAGAAAPVTPITGAPVPKDATVVKPLAVKPADEAAPVAVKAGEKRPAEAKVGEIPAAKKVASKEEEQKPVPMEVDQAGGQAAGKAGIPRVAGDGQEEVRPAAEGTEKEAKAFPSPLGVKASDVDDTSVTLKWTPVTGATDYRVAVTPPDGKVVDPVGGPSVWERTVEGLRPGQDYVFTVAAIGPEGQSNPSKPVKISTAGASGKAKVISPQAGKKKQAGVKREGSGEDIFTSPSQLRRQGDLVTSPSQLRRQGTDDSGSLTSFHTATGEEVMSISSYATAEAGTQEGSPSVHVPQPKLFMSGLLSGISGAFSSLHAGQAGLALNQQQAQMASEVSTIEEISEGEEDELSGAPEFNRGLESCQVARGESVRFECEISGSPPPTIIWLKDGREIDEDNQHFAKYGDDGSFALVITNVTDADSGAYSCQATSKKGQATSTAELTVKPHSIGGEETRGEKIAPIFAAKLTDVNVKEGADARFDCVVAGTPGIEVTWFKDGVPVRNGGNRMLTFRGDGSCSLDVTSVTCDDAGVYDVQAANIAGTSKCSALLVVQQLEQKNSVHTHKPASQPVSLATIQEEVKVQDLKPPTEISTPYVSDSAVTVSWKPVAGATDYNVIVSPADGVVRGSDDGPTFPERRVEGLRSGTEYTFTVVATRKNGHAVAGVPLTQMTRELPTPGALRSESVTDTGMTLAWLPTPGATDYEVSISPPGGDVQPPSGAATEPQRVISGLEPAKEYEVTVTAKIGDKRSAQCEPFKITTKPLGTPAGFNASKITDNSMFVSWTPVGGATDYEVKLDPPAGEAKLTEKGSTVPERQLTGLSGGIEYRISVGAKNQKGDVVWAEPFSVETKDLPTPSGTDVSGLTDNEMTVTWAPVPGATDYTLKVQPQVGEVEVPPEGPGEARRHLMGLLPGVDYTVVVEAKGDKRKRSAASAPIKVKTKALCSPSDIKTSSVTASTAMLEWEMVPGATDYKLHMEPSDGQVTKPKKGGHLPQREVKNLTPGREYVFKITAVSPAGNSAPSQEIKINTPALAAPSSISPATVTDNSAGLKWTAVPGATDYTLTVEPAGGEVWETQAGPGDPERVITGLQSGTEYEITVSATGPDGASAPSERIRIKTEALAAPSEVKQATVANEEIVLKWNPVAGATDYELTVEPPAGDIVALKNDRARPMRRLTGLTPGTEYKIVVVAKDAKGNTRKSDTFTATTLNIPKAEGLRAYDITDTTVYLEWAAISGSKDYTINLRPSAIASVSAPENDMTKPERLVQGLQPSTEYNISVSAITADGRGPPCNPVTIVTKALPMPEDFKLVNVTDETALINWASIEGAKDFHVAVEPEGPKVVPTEAGKSASERALRGLQPARDYWVTVTAKNEKGESNESQTFSFKTMALSTPSGFKTSHVTDTTCVLSWTPVSGSDDYTVKVQPQGGEIAVPSAGPSASERHLKRLKGKTTYTVTIVATSSKGKSAESQSFTFTTTELPSPSGVEVSSVTASGLVMAWSPVPGATDYIITSEPDARVSPGEGGKSDARRVVSGLEPGTEYTFTVVAVSTEGSSAACEPVKVKTRVLDTPAKIEVATATTNTAVITWTAVKGATDYKIVVEPPGAEVLVDKEGPAAPKRILKGLHPDTHYHVYVTAISAAGESTRSEALEIQTAALPSPARLSAPTVTDRNVIVSWAPTEGAEEYIVKVEPECEVVPTAGGPGATERELRNLKPATEYTIRVAAKGPLGTSAYTEPLPIRTNALPAPSKVEVPFVSDKEVRVSWAAVPGATDYHVKTQPEASVQHGEGGPGAPERIVTGLKPNTEYSIRVVALTKKGSSGLTEPVEVTTKALETPSKIMPASTTADTAVITWSAVKGATDYKVVVEPSGPDVVVDKEGPAAPKRILKGLHPDSEYTAYVTAVGAAGDSTRSEPFTLKTPGLPVPARLGTPTVTDRNVIVSWAPIEGAEEYIVKVEPECEVVPTAGGRGAPERELRNLKPATEYIVRVAAKFPQGTSAESEHLSIRTNALPAPAGVEVPFVSDKEVRVSWPAVPGATDYHVKTQPEASVQPGEGGPDAPVRIVTGMNPKTEYSIRVVALTKKGSSALSEPVKVTTKALPRPNESRVKSVTDNSAIIAWTGIQGAADYQISVEPKCEVKQTKKATAPERELRGLLSGTEYTVTITAVGKAGTSAVSEPLIVRTKALLPPTDVQASSVTDSSLLLVWKHVEGATSYIISAEPDKARVQLVDDTKGKAAPERLLTQLWPNTEYAFTIIAVSNEESSMECEPFKVKTLALSKPSRVTAGKVGDTSALLVWAPAEAATNYVLAVNPQAEVIPTDKGPSGAERVLKGLKTNTEYTVSVTAKNPDGTSAPSDEFVFKTRALPSPEKPSQGAVTDTTATVAWAAVPGASDYVVKVDPEGQVMETADGAGAPVRQIQGLKPGTEYKVVVAGKGEKGDGAECEPIVIKTNPLPSPAGIKTTSVVDNKLTLGWTAVPGATDYKVVSSPEDVQVVTRKGGRADSERAITGLRPGTEYSFSVVAVCPDGSSAQTEPVKVTTKALPTPGGVKAGTVGDTTATVVWSNVPGASDYTVQVEPAGEAVLTKEGPAAPVREIRGLQAGQEYRVAVVGKGPSGESAPCEPISIKTNTLATPSGLKPSTVDDTSVTLAWTSVPGATDYVISGVPKGSKVSPGKDGPAGAERVITGLKAGTDYSLSVTAVGSKGESGVGQPVLVTTKALPTPGDVAVSSSDDSATISWAPVPGAKDYEIVTDPPAQVSPTDKGPLAAERVVKGLEPGTDYEVQIAATNDKGESNQCRPVKFSTKACQRPTGVKSPSVTDNQATLTWSPVPGATDYRVLVEPAEGSVKLPTGGPGEAERTLVGLTAGAEYTVSVIGMTEKGSGEASEPLKITTRADEEVVPPAAPAQLKPTEPATKPAEAAAPTEEEKKEGKPEAMTPTVEKEPEDKLPPAASKAEVKSTAEPAAPVPDKKEEVLPKPEAVTVAAEEMVVEVTPDKATVPKPTEVEQKGEEKLPPTAPKAAVKPSAEKPTVGEKLEERPTTLEAVEELMGAVEVPGPGAVPKGKKEQPREGIPEGESAKPEAAVAKPKEAAKALPSPADVRVNHVTESGMSLGWSPVPGAARYEVAVQTEGIELLTGKTTNVEYQIDGLKPSKKYHYSVTAIGADGTRSAPSKTFHQITKALSTPGGIKPSSLTETGATIAWKPVSGATNYTVSVTPAHGRVVESSGGAAGAERRLTDLQPNTEYTVSIAAEGVKGTSATSTPIVLKTKDDEERKRREAEELRQKQHKEEEERKQQVLLKQQKEEDQKQQALLEKQRKEEEQRKQQDLLDKQRREKEENELLEKQRREAEEEKRRQQNLLEKQRQEEEDNKRKELAEKERLAEEERKQQELLEKQRKEEDKKQKELAEKRQAEEQRKEQELLDKQRQDEEKARNEKELLEKQRKLEDEKKQKELQEKQSKEEDQKKQLEKQRKEEEDRKQKSLLEKKRKDEEERKQKELLEKQKKEEGEKKRKELEKKKLEDEKKQKEQEEERKKKEILDKKKKEEELKQKELLEKKKKEEEDQKKKQLLEKKKKDEEAAATAPEEVEEEEEPEEFSTGISAFAEARQAAKEQQSIEVRAAPVVTIDASAYAAMAVAHHPTSVRTSMVQDRTLMLNWDPVVGAEDYDVTFEPCGDAEVFLTDYGPVAPMRKIRGLKPCKTYKITVAAKKANKERTKESEVIKVTTKALPTPSEFRAIRCLDNKVLFGFDAVYGATSYIVGTDSKEGVSRVTRIDYDRVEVEITDLLPAKEYQVTVTAQGPKGVSAPSKYFTIGTKVITEPEDLVAKADSENDMTVTWSHVKGATDYEFLITPEGKVREAGSTTRKVSGLKPGVEYRISVAAKKGELVGSSAITRSFTKALARPDGMRCVSASDTSVIVAWNRVQGATGYDVETRPSGGTAITPKLPGAPEREIAGLRPATEYEIIITGRSSRGDGLASKPLKIKTKAFGAVSSIRVTDCTDTKALIRWSPVNGATSYDVKLDPSEGRIRQTNGSQSPEREVTGLVPNKEYSVTIIPKSASGEGSANKPFSFTTMALSTPTNIKVTEITEEGMSLTWDEVPGAYDYTVWMDPPGATIIAGSGGDRAPERHISRLKSNKEYSISIVAESPRGNSCRSDPVEVTTEALHGPTGLKTTNITQTGMRLTFNPVANARDYEVILRPRLGTVFPPGRGNDPTQSERIIEDLKPNTEYDISVIAITHKGVKSEVSKSIKRRTYAFPPPSGVTATSTTGTTVTLQWPAVPGADNYTVDTSPRGGETHRTDKGANAPERLVKGLQPGTVYEFTVTAKGKGGQSPPGETFKHRTKGKCFNIEPSWLILMTSR